MVSPIENISEKVRKTTKDMILTKGNSREIEKKLTDLGFEYIGSGLDKIVFLCPDKRYVVKIEVYKYDQVKNEIEFYRSLPKSVKKYYLKPLAYDKKNFKWLIAKRAKTVADGLTYEEAEKIEHKILIKIKGKTTVGVTDIGPCNVGSINGKPVMIDYGYV